MNVEVHWSWNYIASECLRWARTKIDYLVCEELQVETTSQYWCHDSHHKLLGIELLYDIYTFLHIHECHVYMYIYIHTMFYAYYVDLQPKRKTHIHTYSFNVHIYTYIQLQVCIRIHIYIYTYIHICLYVNWYTDMSQCF